MEETKTNSDILQNHLQRYLGLRKLKDSNSKAEAEKALQDLFELLIVEIYFMKCVRLTIPDEEMSGFVLYAKDYFRRVLSLYDPKKGPFMPFFSTAMERRATTYIKEKDKRDKLERFYILNYLPYEDTTMIAEPSPEEYLVRKEEENEDPEPFRKAEQTEKAEKLRFVCAMKPLRQKRVFIFLCTQLPYLPVDTIDSICTTLNYDKDQTFQLARYLYCVENDRKCVRNSPRYNEMRREFFWSRSLELENRMRRTKSEEVQRMLDYNRQMCKRPIDSGAPAKRHVSYPELGRILNIKESTIATAVHDSKRLLKMITEDSIREDKILGRLFSEKADEICSVQASAFEPFKEFGIGPEKLANATTQG